MKYMATRPGKQRRESRPAMAKSLMANSTILPNYSIGVSQWPFNFRQPSSFLGPISGCRSEAIFRQRDILVSAAAMKFRQPLVVRRVKATSGSPGLYSAQRFDLTAENVDLVLEDVRPYLIADGGNVDVVSVEDGVVSLKLQGACGTCPSSTTTMRMGIEKVLKEKFGEAIKDIRQVFDEFQSETTAEAVDNHLNILRPAIKNFGGSVEVLSVVGGDCTVRYIGPDSIGSGIKAAIKEKFPDIVNVVFTS